MLGAALIVFREVLEAAYGYLKTLSDYKDAKDVMEGVKI